MLKSHELQRGHIMPWAVSRLKREMPPQVATALNPEEAFLTITADQVSK